MSVPCSCRALSGFPCSAGVLVSTTIAVSCRRPDSRVLMPGVVSSAFFVSLPAFAVLTRTLFLSIALEPHWIRLGAPLRAVRGPRADLQAVRLLGRDGAPDGSMSLGVEHVELRFAGG